MSKTKERAAADKANGNGKSIEDLAAGRAKILAEVGAFDQKLEELAAKHAAELATDEPNAAKLDQLEAERDRLKKERERLASRAGAIENLAIPAARRRAAEETMRARAAEYRRLGKLAERGTELARGPIEALRSADKAWPWPANENHPGALMAVLAEEIAFDAREAGVEPPTLEPVPQLTSADLQDLIGISRLMARRVEYLRGGIGGPLTKRGRAERNRLAQEQRDKPLVGPKHASVTSFGDDSVS